ncbi:ATP-binding cassette domain-containing protein [Clostridium ljungdahlii]|uniref:ATP-binding cassette domain-containing protein n=1 Tax=Clostridium ljungdahlii TaxID=1538 RepID=UPI0038678C60
MDNILEVKNLKVAFKTKNSIKEVVKGINFQVKKGKVTCIVGESGSGKTMTVMSIINVLPKNAFIEDGSIIFNNGNISKLNNSEMKKIRGKRFFQYFKIQ